jgi:hypothetical protein
VTGIPAVAGITMFLFKAWSCFLRSYEYGLSMYVGSGIHSAVHGKIRAGMYEDSGPATNATIAAISSTRP